MLDARITITAEQTLPHKIVDIKLTCPGWSEEQCNEAVTWIGKETAISVGALYRSAMRTDLITFLEHSACFPGNKGYANAWRYWHDIGN